MKKQTYQSTTSIISFFKKVKIDNNKSEEENREIVKSKLLTLMQHFRKYSLFPLNFTISVVYIYGEEFSKAKMVKIQIIYEFKFPTSYDYETQSEIFDGIKSHISEADFPRYYFIRGIPLEKKHRNFKIETPYDNDATTTLANNFFDILSMEIQNSNLEELKCSNTRYSHTNEKMIFEYDLNVKTIKNERISKREEYSEEEH